MSARRSRRSERDAGGRRSNKLSREVSEQWLGRHPCFVRTSASSTDPRIRNIPAAWCFSETTGLRRLVSQPWGPVYSNDVRAIAEESDGRGHQKDWPHTFILGVGDWGFNQ
jgi:hypothetical protein